MPVFCDTMNENDQKEVFLELLENYRKLRCLWDPKHSYYNNKQIRNQAYGDLLKIYMKIKPNATIPDLKKKLENMRTTFNREMKKINERTGLHPYIPKLWYFDQLMFLHEIGVTKDEAEVEEEIIPVLDKASEDEALPEECTEPSSNITITLAPPSPEEPAPQPPPEKKQRLSLALLKTQEQLVEATHSLVKSRTDPYELLGTSFGMQLRQLKGNQQAIAQKLMSDVLFYGKMNKLTEYSSIQLFPIIVGPPQSVLASAKTTHCNTPGSASFTLSESTAALGKTFSAAACNNNAVPGPASSSILFDSTAAIATVVSSTSFNTTATPSPIAPSTPCDSNAALPSAVSAVSCNNNAVPSPASSSIPHDSAAAIATVVSSTPFNTNATPSPIAPSTTCDSNATLPSVVSAAPCNTDVAPTPVASSTPCNNTPALVRVVSAVSAARTQSNAAPSPASLSTPTQINIRTKSIGQSSIVPVTSINNDQSQSCDE